MTIAPSFRTILDRCAFTSTESLRLERRRDEVSRCLRSRLDVSKVKTIGSYARKTTIRQTSDIDLLAVLRLDGLRRGGRRVSSTTALHKVRTALGERYPTTSIGRDGQAVVIDFADGDTIDVVPGVWVSAMPDGWPVYEIPNGRGGWMPTSPGSHNRYITAADTRSGHHLRSVAKLFKYWRWCRSNVVPINSFHVGLLLASEDLCRVGSTNRESLALLLNELSRRQCEALDDPLGISGKVPACDTRAKRRSVLKTVRISAARSATAIAAERAGKERDARAQWGMVFNGGFPR